MPIAREQRCFLRCKTIFLSSLTGSELRLFKNLTQSVSQKIDKFAVP